MTGRFAEVGRAVDHIVHVDHGPLALALRDILYRRAEEHAHLVLASPEQMLDLPAVRAKHVVGAAQQLAIQTHLGQCIQSLAKYENAVCFMQTGFDMKDAPIFPIALGDPLYAFLFIAHERIGNSSGG